MTKELAYAALFGFVALGVYGGVGFYRRYRESFLRQAEVQLDQLYSPLTPQQLWLFTILGVVALGAGGFLVTGFKPLAGLAGLGLGLVLPRLYVRAQLSRRLKKFDEQLVDALVLIANSLKAGMNLPQAIEMVTREMGPPVSQEFGLAIKENRMGTPIEQVLIDLAKRVGSEDLQITVDAIVIARETGGSLAELFDKIAATILERNRVRGKLDSLTSTARTQGLVMTLMPWGLAGVLYLLDPAMISPMFTTWMGQALMVLVVVLELIGWFIIRRIVAIDI